MSRRNDESAADYAKRMRVYRAEPPAVRAVRKSLAGATSPDLIVRLSDMLARLKSTYGLPPETEGLSDADLRVARFAAATHRGHVQVKQSPTGKDRPQ